MKKFLLYLWQLPQNLVGLILTLFYKFDSTVVHKDKIIRICHDFPGGISLGEYIFVVKKNVSVLSKLYKWLKDNNYNRLEECVNAPLLLIDDEADNASVNTNKDETNPTRTNAIIRKICSLFKTASYVGFTATPFANVFIDPDSVDAMKKEEKAVIKENLEI